MHTSAPLPFVPTTTTITVMPLQNITSQPSNPPPKQPQWQSTTATSMTPLNVIPLSHAAVAAIMGSPTPALPLLPVPPTVTAGCSGDTHKSSGTPPHSQGSCSAVMPPHPSTHFQHNSFIPITSFISPSESRSSMHSTTTPNSNDSSAESLPPALKAGDNTAFPLNGKSNTSSAPPHLPTTSCLTFKPHPPLPRSPGEILINIKEEDALREATKEAEKIGMNIHFCRAQYRVDTKTVVIYYTEPNQDGLANDPATDSCGGLSDSTKNTKPKTGNRRLDKFFKLKHRLRAKVQCNVLLHQNS